MISIYEDFAGNAWEVCLMVDRHVTGLLGFGFWPITIVKSPNGSGRKLERFQDKQVEVSCCDNGGGVICFTWGGPGRIWWRDTGLWGQRQNSSCDQCCGAWEDFFVMGRIRRAQMQRGIRLWNALRSSGVCWQESDNTIHVRTHMSQFKTYHKTAPQTIFHYFLKSMSQKKSVSKY